MSASKLIVILGVTPSWLEGYLFVSYLFVLPSGWASVRVVSSPAWNLTFEFLHTWSSLVWGSQLIWLSVYESRNFIPRLIVCVLLTSWASVREEKVLLVRVFLVRVFSMKWAIIGVNKVLLVCAQRVVSARAVVTVLVKRRLMVFLQPQLIP